MIRVILCAMASLAYGASSVPFQTHYIRLGSQDTSVAMCADAAGNLFIVSATQAGIRVTKSDPGGAVIAALDFGPGVVPTAAALDGHGNLFVAGNSFLAKVDNALANVLANASLPARANAVVTDASGNVYVAGTADATFPTTPGAFESSPPLGAAYAFVEEFAPDLSKVMSATLFGSPFADCSQTYDTCRGLNGPGLFAATTATAITIDSAGAVLIAGYTNGAPAPLSTQPYNYGFVARFSADLSSLLGNGVFNPAGNPNGETYFRAMALDPQGNVLLAGGAGDIGALSGTLQPAPPRSGGNFVVKMDGGLQTLLWGTYFGANDLPGKGVAGIAVDAAGDIWITGISQENFLPNSTSTNIGYLPFVAELTPDGSSILNLIASQLAGAAVTMLPNGGAAVLGSTDSFLMPALPGQPPLLLVANSANNQSSGTIAPAELISLYGAGIWPPSPVGGYQVLFNGVPAPLLYAGPNQINVMSPTTIAGQQTVDIEVTGPLGTTTAFPTVFVDTARPQLFSVQRSYVVPFTPGAMQAAIFAIANNQDGSLNAESNPALRGSIVTLWATGTGLPGSSLPIAVLNDAGQSLEILYAGQAPDAIDGLTQINFRIPPDAIGAGRPFQYSVRCQMNGAVSAAAVIEVATN